MGQTVTEEPSVTQPRPGPCPQTSGTSFLLSSSATNYTSSFLVCLVRLRLHTRAHHPHSVAIAYPLSVCLSVCLPVCRLSRAHSLCPRPSSPVYSQRELYPHARTPPAPVSPHPQTHVVLPPQPHRRRPPPEGRGRGVA